MQQGEFDKKEQLELHTDEYIANFDFFVNCSEQPKEWLDWLKVLGLSVIDAKRIDEELALLPDREIANAELAALSLASSKYFISKQDILLEKILPPSCYADKIRLAVLKRVLMANKFSNPQDKWQANQDNKIRHKLTEINRLLGYQSVDEQQAVAVEDVGTGNHAYDKKQSQLHIFIWRVHQELNQKEKPTAQKLWREIQKHYETHDIEKIIQEVTGEKILWCSGYGNEQQLQRQSFNKLLSNLRKNPPN